MSAQSAAPTPKPMTVLVYSDDVTVRSAVRLALGKRPAPELPSIELREVATEAAVLSALDGGDIDVAVFDGEAVPAGGMGMCRSAKDEVYNCPPILVLVARAQDGWLATWSKADAIAAHPVDPIVLADQVAALMRRRLAALPA